MSRHSLTEVGIPGDPRAIFGDLGLDHSRFLSLLLSFPAASSRTNVCTTHDNDDSPKLATNFHRQHTSGWPDDDNDDGDDGREGGGCEDE